MPAYKDKAKGTWYVSFYYENWTGKKEKKMKRGVQPCGQALWSESESGSTGGQYGEGKER